jgi:hypothetical protein
LHQNSAVTAREPDVADLVNLLEGTKKDDRFQRSVVLNASIVNEVLLVRPNESIKEAGTFHEE